MRAPVAILAAFLPGFLHYFLHPFPLSFSLSSTLSKRLDTIQNNRKTNRKGEGGRKEERTTPTEQDLVLEDSMGCWIVPQESSPTLTRFIQRNSSWFPPLPFAQEFRELLISTLFFSPYLFRWDFLCSFLLHLWGGEEQGESWGSKGPAVIAVSQVSSCSSIKLEFFIFLFFLSCFSPFPFCSAASSTFGVMISPNYASGNRDLDEIFGLRGTRIHLSVFLMCSLMVISTLNSLNCQECSWQTCGHGCGFRGLCL